MEFQAVIMAAGRGSRMTDLTACLHKPLLPVGNKPVIWYPINLLAKAGFEDIIVVVLKSAYADVKHALDEVHQVGVRLDYFTVSDDIANDSDDSGTADTLRQLVLDGKIMTDMLVVSCDLVVGDEVVETLHELADVYRRHNATVAMLISPSFNYTDASVACPGGPANRRLEKDFIGVDKTSERVLFLSAESDLEQVSFRLSQLQRFPFIEIHTQLVDTHLYLIRKSVLHILHDNKSVRTVKGDLIPLLVRQQFLNGAVQHSADCGSQPTIKSTAAAAVAAADETKTELRQCTIGSDFSMFDVASGGQHTDNVISCYTKVQRSGICLRANTLVAYCEANRQVARLQEATKSTSRHGATESMLGAGVTVGDKASVKSSVIGDQCFIADRVKLTNCVIMDHVKIEPGANIVGCIICSNACIGAAAELRDCLIGTTHNQPVTGKHTNEIILERNQHLMEI